MNVRIQHFTNLMGVVPSDEIRIKENFYWLWYGAGVRNHVRWCDDMDITTVAKFFKLNNISIEDDVIQHIAERTTDKSGRIYKSKLEKYLK